MKDFTEIINKRLIFDSHAHYDSDKFLKDRDTVLTSLPEKGICGVINAASNLSSASQSIKIATQYAFVWAAAGIHPHDAEKSTQDGGWQMKLRSLLTKDKVVAVGEIGLDFHYDFSPREVQRETFIKQIEIANELDLPIIVHEREAGKNVWEILAEYKPKGVVHAFSGSAATARELVKAGMYIGVGGVLTFANARKIVEVADAIPIERILLETDAPYLTPAPFRGRRNDSSMIIYVAQKLAEIKGLGIEQVLKITRDNTCDLFGINL